MVNKGTVAVVSSNGPKAQIRPSRLPTAAITRVNTPVSSPRQSDPDFPGNPHDPPNSDAENLDDNTTRLINILERVIAIGNTQSLNQSPNEPPSVSPSTDNSTTSPQNQDTSAELVKYQPFSFQNLIDHSKKLLQTLQIKVPGNKGPTVLGKLFQSLFSANKGPASYQPLSVQHLIDHSGKLLQSLQIKVPGNKRPTVLGKLFRYPFSANKGPTPSPLSQNQDTSAELAKYQPLSVQHLIDHSGKLLQTLQIKVPENKRPTVLGELFRYPFSANKGPTTYQRLSVQHLIDHSGKLLQSLQIKVPGNKGPSFFDNAGNFIKGVVNNLTRQPAYTPLSITKYLENSHKLLTLIQFLPRADKSFTKNSLYQEFITKLLSDTSSAFDKYYPERLKITEAGELKQDEKLLQFKTLDTPDEKPQKTYTATIEKMGDGIYLPKMTLDIPDVKPKEPATTPITGGGMNAMIVGADKLLKQIMSGIQLKPPKKTYGGINVRKKVGDIYNEASKKVGDIYNEASKKANKVLYERFFDPPNMKPRIYHASDDIKGLFAGTDTKLIFKKESAVKYTGNEVDPTAQRKIELDELKINAIENVEDREDSEKDYRLSMEKMSTEKLQQLVNNSALADESKAALENVLGLSPPPPATQGGSMTHAESFAREIFRPTVILK